MPRLVALLAVACASGPVATAILQARALGASARGVAAVSPVTRVSELLKELGAKVEQEGKAEEQLYNKFVCWGRSVIAAKKASNAEGQSRADELATYVADIDAGRVEFTSERADLEKSLEEVNSDLEAAAEMRAKEHSDFTEANAEMDKAIAALEEAISVLKEATEEHKEGTLLALRGQLAAASGEGLSFSARAEAAVRLRHAADLGEKFLTNGDAVFLRRVLTGEAEVPTADWNKLNRKATFKMSYKARSFKIQEVLTKLLATFQASSNEAKSKEADSVALHEKLKSSKEEQKGLAEEALMKLEKESGAKGMNRAEAVEETDILKEQISDDTKYIEQVEASISTKTEEWQSRSTLRAGEMAAITKAIAILTSDDAKDLIKRSIKSQGYSLLQQASRSVSAVDIRHSGAAAVLEAAAAAGGDRRVAALAARTRLVAHAGNVSHFVEVVGAIDKMTKLLMKEEASELAKKEGCETDRMDDTREAAVKSRAMDELTDTISVLNSEISAHDAEISDKQAEVKTIEEQLAEAATLRAGEAAAYAVAKKDDSDAVAVVKEATSVLQQFYQENSLMLVQQPVMAGEAPPPPPATWEAPYGGKTGESTSILAVLKMIKEDFEKDIAKADEAESKAIADYTKLKTDLEADVSGLNSFISNLQGTVAQKQSDALSAGESRGGLYKEVGGVMKSIKEKEPGCDYFTINYPVRSKNRQIEVDGLLKAKAILSSGSFATPEDPTREMRPGDAL